MANYLTFANLIDEVERAVKLPGGSKIDLIKMYINMVYLNELLVCDELYPLHWLLDFDDTLGSVGPTDITAISQANPAVVTAASHGFSVGDLIAIYNVLGMTEVNNRTYQVGTAAQGYSTNAIPLVEVNGTAVDSSGYTAYTSDGEVVHRGVTLSKTIERILPKAIKWHDEDVLTVITPEELEQAEDKDWWTDSTCRPERFLHRKEYQSDGDEVDMLLWFPGADNAYDLRYWFEKRAARLEANGDVPQLPWKFHHSIVAGAVTRLAENNVQVENAVIWPQIYGRQIQALKDFNRRWYTEHDVMERRKPYLL